MIITYKILYAKKINMGLDLEKNFAIKFSTMAPDLDFFPTKNFLTMPLDLEKFSNSIFFLFHYAPGIEKKIK